MKRLGFLVGVRAFFSGARWVITSPRVWPFAAIPVFVALVLGAVFVGGGLWGAYSLSDSLRNASSTLGVVGGWALTVVLSITALIVGSVLGLTLAQPVSGPALDALSRRAEVSVGGEARPDGPFWPTIFRGLRVTFTGLLFGLPVLALLALIGLMFPVALVVTVPLKFVVTGLLLSWDFMDYPFGLRAIRVRDRVAFIRKNFTAVVGFGLVCAGLLLIPAAGLLVLPLGVAGATRLVVEIERTGGV